MKFYKPEQAAPLMRNALTGETGISTVRVRQLCQQGRIGQRVGHGYIISSGEIDTFNELVRSTGKHILDSISTE